MRNFELISPYRARGDQPAAIRSLTEGARRGDRGQILLGVTGSGKTFTMANVIQELNRPTLVIAHNKTLAGQLCAEFKAFFPHNAVEYFISYYDYYQPEAYIPGTDTYIEKDASINDEIDRMRHSATASLMERRDVIVVSSVSCIYGLGAPENYRDQMIHLREGMNLDRDELLEKLVGIQYMRNDHILQRGHFSVRGDTVDIFPSSYDKYFVRVSFFGDEIESLEEIDRLNKKPAARRSYLALTPASHYAVSDEKTLRAIAEIEAELEERLAYFSSQGKLVEAYRLEQKTRYDLEMLRETGFCKGIENYSRHLDGRKPGEAPYTLLDFFPDDYLLMIDESHVTIPQIGAMYKGDRSRKDALVEFGFRLPSAYDNRPLHFGEFEQRMGQSFYISATPALYEKEHSSQTVEQIIRPTGLLDPIVEVHETEGQIEYLMEMIHRAKDCGDRSLVLTLTKRSAEEVSAFLHNQGFKVSYLHSDIVNEERMETLRDLRRGKYDVLVGINLLREGIDLPEVSLIAIFDADQSGFLRNETSLVQMIGRAARHVRGRVILFADEVTEAMLKAMQETERRRHIQERYNEEHQIVPQSVQKEIREAFDTFAELPERKKARKAGQKRRSAEEEIRAMSPEEKGRAALELERKMYEASDALDFEAAARFRDLMILAKEGGERSSSSAKEDERRK